MPKKHKLVASVTSMTSFSAFYNFSKSTQECFTSTLTFIMEMELNKHSITQTGS